METNQQENTTRLEAWQIEAVQALLATPTNEVEGNQRVYISSETYGRSRFHLIDKRYDGVQVEQVDIEEKWGKRVNFSSDEVPHVLKTLLTWYLEERQQTQERKASTDDALGDLDDDEHPF
jgi:hypothetical protein